MPADAPELELGAALGLVIGRTACRVSEAEALDHVAGCVIVADVSVPHASFYRPQVRFKARDGFCPIGPRVVGLAALGDLGRLAIRVHVDGELVHESSTAGWIRSPARLLAEVTDFMTLAPGDMLMIGVPHGAPRGRAGQRSAIEIDGLGRLENRFVATPRRSVHEARPRRLRRRRARGDAARRGARLRLADGRVVAEDAVVWLPPFEVGTVIALGLNYADHAKELAVQTRSRSRWSS